MTVVFITGNTTTWGLREALRGPSASECYSFLLYIYIILISSQRDFNTKKINPAAMPFILLYFPELTRVLVFWFFSDSLHAARTRDSKLTFVSTWTANTNCSDSQQRPRFHFKRAAAHGLNTTLPTEEGTQAVVGACNAPRHRCHSVGSRTERDGGEAKTLLVQFIFWYLLRCKENVKKNHHLFLKSNWSFKGVHTSLIEPVNMYSISLNIYIFFANIRPGHQIYYHPTKYW